jgi:hypothetical protein
MEDSLEEERGKKTCLSATVFFRKKKIYKKTDHRKQSSRKSNRDDLRPIYPEKEKNCFLP